MKLNKKAFTELITANLKYIREQPKTLESIHIETVLKASIDLHYPEPIRFNPDTLEEVKKPEDHDSYLRGDLLLKKWEQDDSVHVEYKNALSWEQLLERSKVMKDTLDQVQKEVDSWPDPVKRPKFRFLSKLLKIVK